MVELSLKTTQRIATKHVRSPSQRVGAHAPFKGEFYYQNTLYYSGDFQTEKEQELVEYAAS